MRRVFADGDAGAARKAGSRREHQLRVKALRFGIMAPLAAQRASLEKDGRSDAGAVVHTKTLNEEEKGEKA